jgi:carbon-monoxide dehydrogenase medium subunit
MRRFQYLAPNSLDEAVALLKEHGDGVRLLAGGTDLMVHMKEGGLHPPAVVSLHAHPAVRERYTALADGAGIVGSVQTRNMATVGGNVANAAPSADTTPPLIVFDAVAEIVGPGGRREMAVAELATGPGKTSLAPGEVIVAFRLATPAAHTGSVYQRHTPRKIMDIAVVGVGIRLTLDGGKVADARVALGAVAPTVIRATDAEQALVGQSPSEELFAKAAELAQGAARPISDVRGSAEFRSYLVGAMTKRCLGIALERAR